MLIHEIKFIVRSLRKRKIVSLINIFGLAIGLASFILITLYVDKEFKTDKFQENYNRICRIENKFGAYNSDQANRLFKEQIPEFDKIAVMHADWSNLATFEVNGKQFDPGKIIFANNDFKDIFQFDTLTGNAAECLEHPNSVVLTEITARKLFGEAESVGKAIQYHSDEWGSLLLTVTAVIKDYPQNSSLKFDGIISVSSLDIVEWYKQGKDHWGQIIYLSFVKIKDVQKLNTLTDKMNELMKAHAPEWVLEDDLPYRLKPLSELYFDTSTGYSDDLLKHTNKYKLILILIIGLLIPVIACINQVNLTTAQSCERLKKFNIRKTIGAPKGWIFVQLVLESLLLSFMSFLLACLFIFIVLPAFNDLTGSSFSVSGIFSFQNLMKYALLVPFVGVITGILPSYLLSSRMSLRSARKINVSGLSRSHSRSLLTVAQFAITIVLMICSLVILEQVGVLTGNQVGFDKEKMIYFYLPANLDDRKKTLREELMRIPEVENVAFSSLVPGDANRGDNAIALISGSESRRVKYHAINVSEDFIELFGLEIVKGESFKQVSSALHYPVVINETAAREFGLDDPLKARIAYGKGDNSGNIVGIVKDFNYRSLHYPMDPLILMLQPDDCSILNLKMNTKSFSQTETAIHKIKRVWDKYSIDIPFDIRFLDEDLQNMYRSEKKFLKTFNLFAAISIFISCMGLLGMSLFIVENRTKEIGIRKVNGAKVSEILTMLNKDFIKWVAIAFVIATPVAYYVMQKWLENFAYKTELSWWIFALAGLLALGIALLTVSWQSWKAATRNPVEALRYE
ncbi:MAG: ABC transporter permease [Bacteroidales bacterium]|nr:ABC transporter permease [Bacteroidales bacterium]